MKRSTERILTTHVGSLTRPPEIIDAMRARVNQQPYDAEMFAENLRKGVSDIVRRQAEIGIDIVSDGEFGKSGFAAYTNERLGGFERRPGNPGESVSRGKDRKDFAEFYREYDRLTQSHRPVRWRWVCTGPITYDPTLVQIDIANFNAALAGVAVTEAFMPVAAPITVETDRPNEYYPTQEAYLYAIADALKQEYQAIADAGFLLQLDDPWITARWDQLLPDIDLQEFQKFCETRIEATNYALADIPRERIRYHICWGSWHGPHSTDIPIKHIQPLFLKVKAGAYLFEAANVRHEHESSDWQNSKPPEGTLLVPGVVTHATNLIEHPELVAQRIVRFAKIVGRENVLAGTDCGFSQGPFSAKVHPTIQWAKLRALVEGARLASKELWS
ncbi:MAG TPA: cobalamin-independent methionine synthase II family protein [Terriglobales bacterium]|jgi:5-methyltetrahydropteroyltriglutamate--homocysteine methyltransferase|nr:cobalamin-independent methionine synthase II family protein [Terriglobales bacterium]